MAEAVLASYFSSEIMLELSRTDCGIDYTWLLSDFALTPVELFENALFGKPTVFLAKRPMEFFVSLTINKWPTILKKPKSKATAGLTSQRGVKSNLKSGGYFSLASTP